MVDWVLVQRPDRVVDPGCGSGRFAAEVARRSPDLDIVAIDVDPLATLTARATLRTLRARRAVVMNADYTTMALRPIPGRTAFVGNPPYVRHHELPAEQKAWAKSAAARLSLSISGLAGLQVHFFLATLMHARRADVGCFITSAEWLDVRYGAVLRDALLNGMGAISLHLLDRGRFAFRDAMTTAVITCFEVGVPPTSLRLHHVRSASSLGSLTGGRRTRRARLADSQRWSPFFLPRGLSRAREGLVPLGEIARVSRGIATGANGFFVLTEDRASELRLADYVVPVLADASDVLTASGIVRRESVRRVLLAPPRDINLEAREHAALRAYLLAGKERGVAERYLCQQRTPWWYLAVKTPPVIATYMTRQGPAFALNPDQLAILNVLHGIFPRAPMNREQLAGLVYYLNTNRKAFMGAGRTYQGGLEKFEPREMEALLVPRPERLQLLGREHGVRPA
jgi:SAM-dependent methyltransferase